MKPWTRRDDARFIALAIDHAIGTLRPEDIPTFRRLTTARRLRRTQREREEYWAQVKFTIRLRRHLAGLMPRAV